MRKNGSCFKHKTPFIVTWPFIAAKRLSGRSDLYADSNGIDSDCVVESGSSKSKLGK